MPKDLSQLIRDGFTARREDRPADALRHFTAAVEGSRQAGDRRLLVHALKGQGQIERDAGHSDAARLLYEEAAEICRGLEDPLLLAHTVRHVGDIHQDAGRLQQAAPCYVEALAIYRGHGETPRLDLANTVRPFAQLKQNLGEVEAARHLWQEARDLYAALALQEGVDEADIALARLPGED